MYATEQTAREKATTNHPPLRRSGLRRVSVEAPTTDRGQYLELADLQAMSASHDDRPGRARLAARRWFRDTNVRVPGVRKRPDPYGIETRPWTLTIAANV